MLSIRDLIPKKKKDLARYRKFRSTLSRKGQELDYYRWLWKLAEESKVYFEKVVVERLAAHQFPNKKEFQKQFLTYYKQYKQLYGKRRTDAEIFTKVSKYMEAVESTQQRDFTKQFKKMGVGLDLANSDLLNKKYKEFLSVKIAENVAMVKELTDRQSRRVSNQILTAYKHGFTQRDFAKIVQKEYGVTKSRAATIARTEITKVTNSLSDARASDVGCTEGFWRTMGDNRVSEGHSKLEGKRFKLSKGCWDPEVRKWVLPGRARPNCRCYTEYIIPES